MSVPRRRLSDSSAEEIGRDTPEDSPLLHPLMRASHLDPTAANRPQLTTGDRAYLRKRKIDMDAAFNSDSTDSAVVV